MTLDRAFEEYESHHLSQDYSVDQRTGYRKNQTFGEIRGSYRHSDSPEREVVITLSN